MGTEKVQKFDYDGLGSDFEEFKFCRNFKFRKNAPTSAKKCHIDAPDMFFSIPGDHKFYPGGHGLRSDSDFWDRFSIKNNAAFTHTPR